MNTALIVPDRGTAEDRSQLRRWPARRAAHRFGALNQPGLGRATSPSDW